MKRLVEIMFGYVHNLCKNHRKSLQFASAGIMLSVSLVLPSFYPDALGLRGIWKFSIGVWAVSMITFLCLSARTLVDNGPYTLLSIFVIGFGISNLPLPLEKYGPLATGFGLISTLQTAPVIRSFLIGSPNPRQGTHDSDLELGLGSFNQSTLPSYGPISHTGNPPGPWNPLAHAGAVFNVNNDPVVSISFGSHTTNGSVRENSEVSSDLTSESADRLL
ncbi:hypothetical protein HYFRA_00012847 [Hymenoscyphus fraxineus]|uniref:Uncharacterized protein n=1 Tax=Hymenoscyphus fraxineus TaxID=746836 RepID=A0A9N9L350_9HELO|nr:hypothetical protein HYFRA_00012847 [Hymenoscyphus fraxineus]